MKKLPVKVSTLIRDIFFLRSMKRKIRANVRSKKTVFCRKRKDREADNPEYIIYLFFLPCKKLRKK
jgi:hypothetical protein